ncbi:MAG: hypothetical protein AB7F96_16580 [Beijerinckiaceae bacterium]
MADGFECTKCGYQETVHDHPEYAEDGFPPCKSYTPGAYERELIEERKRERGKSGPPSDAVWLLTPFGMVDIGS